MTRKKLWLGILALAFVFAGCDNMLSGSGGKGSANSGEGALNGTWVYADGYVTTETTFNNGRFEISTNGAPTAKGSYAAAGGRLTMTVEALHGGALDPDGYYGLDPIWYSRDVLILKLRALGMLDSEIEGALGDSNANLRADYVINGDRLTITGNGEVIELTRKGSTKRAPR